MSATRPSTLSGDAEVSRLIELLLETEQQLEQMTSGEVDSVANSAGKMFLLRHAQDRLRQNEAAIFDSLRAHIALLDERGTIVSVNSAWRQFATENDLKSPAFGVGVNYPEICEKQSRETDTSAHEVACGIRSVLSGAKNEFLLEYLCPTPNELSWYLLTVNRVAGDGPRGAVVMHLNITERKHSEQALLRYGAAMDAIADAIYLTDRATMRIIHVNDAACIAHEMSRKQILQLESWTLVGVSREELERTFDTIIENKTAAKPIEMLRARPDGTPVWIELRRHAQRSDEGWTIVTLVRDVTERKDAYDKIKRVYRVYAMLSGINSLIVHVESREELFAEACRIAVDTGGFRMAWIGTIDPKTLHCDIIAWHGGEPGYADKISVTARGRSTDGAAHASRALSFTQPEICNDIAREPSFAPLRNELLRSGHRSIACFPLTLEGRTRAVLALYAGEIDVFDDEETDLLVQLASDLSFALANMDRGERLTFLANYDELTGLGNLKLFLERVGDDIRNAALAANKCGVAVIDIERFKNFNDSLGRDTGDALLKQIAEWLTRQIGDDTLLARVGADKFAIQLPVVALENDVARMLEALMSAFIENPYRLNDEVFRVSAKAGIALYPEDGSDASTLFKNAEAALKQAKSSGDRLLFHKQRMTEAVSARLTLENQLRHAVKDRQFVLHYQPKISLSTGKLTGVEALIRWNDPRTGLVPPADFIPILEETGLILDVGRWALRTAADNYLGWRNAGLQTVRVAVNVSPLQLRNAGFIADLGAAIDIAAGAEELLELEITESLIMEDVEHTIKTLRTVRAMGVSVAIDDFGTGFSSLSYLSRLPVDTLKIDRTFVIEMTRGSQGLALVSTIIGLAHALDLKVVAEGVETDEQSRLLRLLKCDEYQGFLFSKAVPAEALARQFLTPFTP